MFRCISPTHDDKTPSCNTLGGRGTFFHCFGCQSSGDIFKAAHFLENKPLVGKEFVIETLIPLAERFGVDIDSTPLTEAELYELDTYRIYRFASDYIVSHQDDEVFEKEIKARGWNKEICQKYGVGYIDDYENFREYLKGLGFKAGFIDDVDLSRKDIFGPDNIIYTIKDEMGRPVGFAARNLKYTDDKKHGSKYVNQRTTGAKCNIYRKGSRLHGMDQLIRNHLKKDDIVYVFEGYSDVLTAAQNGLTNCVSVGGSNLGVDQVHLLREYGFYRICLCMDGDEAGQTGTAWILDNTLGNQRDMKVHLIIMPDGFDPDNLIRKQGIDAFQKLKQWTAFEWRLNQFSEDIEPETICESMVPLIANEGSAVAREKLEYTLAGHTGISLRAIHEDVEQLRNSREAEIARNRQNIVDRLKRALDIEPANANYLLQEAQTNLYELSKQYDIDNFSEQAYIEALEAQKAFEEAKDGSFSGFILGSDLKLFEEALCGDWKKDVWICIGGKENTGKSSWALKILFSIATHEENDIVGIYHTIDDTREQLTPRLVCLAEGTRTLSINQVIDPNYYVKSGHAKKSIYETRNKGYQSIVDLAREGRFIMKDANDGQSFAYIESLIKFYREKYPNRNLVYVLDNFHKIQDFQGYGKDERVRFRAMSGMMKSLATKYHICIISTVEYPKLSQGQIPTNNNIGETAQIAYDANIICHLYNDLHEYGDKATHFHLDLDGTKLPRLMVNFGKNKVSPYKGRQWYDFYPEQANFRFADMSDVEEQEETGKKKVKNRLEALAVEDD
jgi:DNA primase catalytic core